MERADLVQALFRGDLLAVLPCLLEVAAMLDEFDPEGAHGGVLLHRVAVRHQDDRA